jgi:hypothetical protein
MKANQTSVTKIFLMGIDGCPTGWIAACQGGGNDKIILRHATTIAELLSRFGTPEIAAIDMPLCLPEAAVPGGRNTDRAARRHLGKRGASGGQQLPPIPPLKELHLHPRQGCIRWMLTQPDRGTTATVGRELESESHGLLYFETLC